MIFDAVKYQMENAMAEIRYSIDWYDFTVIPISEKYHTTIDGILQKRIWWFVLREVN